MYKYSILVLAAFLMANLLGSCSSEVSLTGYEEYLLNVAKYKCEREFECCNWNSKKEYRTEKECVEYHKARAAEKMFRLELTQIVFDIENSEKCLNYIMASNFYENDCHDIIETQYNTLSKIENSDNKEACGKVLKGTVQEGEKCHIIDYTISTDEYSGALSECVDGLYCSPSKLVCTKYPKRNEKCADSDKKCSGSNICLMTDTDNGKSAYICNGLPIKDGNSCLRDQYCGEGLECKTEYNDEGERIYLCREKYAKVNQDCSNKTCVEGTYCKREDIGGETRRICRSLKKNGASCASGSNCLSNVCNIVDQYSFEDENGTCSPNFISINALLCK